MINFHIRQLLKGTLLALLASMPLYGFGDTCDPQEAAALEKLIDLRKASLKTIEEMKKLDEQLDKETRKLDEIIALTLSEYEELSRASQEVSKMVSSLNNTSELQKTNTRQRLIYLRAVATNAAFQISEENKEALEEFEGKKNQESLKEQ